MYFFSVDILIKQLLPPTWRVARFKFIKALSAPFTLMKADFDAFRISSISKVNLSAQPQIIEEHIIQITEIVYGVYVADGALPNTATVNVPIAGQAYADQITQFLTNVTPAGRSFTLNFY